MKLGYYCCKARRFFQWSIYGYGVGLGRERSPVLILANGWDEDFTG
jgi:hypothetical protein